MIKPFCKISDTPANKTGTEAMTRLHKWLADLQVHKSHYSRGNCPMRQYTDTGVNLTKLWEDYSSNAIRYEFPCVSANVFRNVFTKVYNISTRYVF